MNDSPDHLLAQLRALPERELYEQIQTLPRASLRAVLGAAGIDDELDEPDEWPCWCRALRCDHALADRLKGMLARLKERQILCWMATLRRRNFRFLPEPLRRKYRYENLPPELQWSECRELNRFAAIRQLEDLVAVEFLFSLRLESIDVLQAFFPRPRPEGNRDYYLPADPIEIDDEEKIVNDSVQALALRRLSSSFEVPLDPFPTLVCPGKPKVKVMARRRGAGQEGDTATARANPLLGFAALYDGDMSLGQLPAGLAREGKENLPNGEPVLDGKIRLCAEVLADLAARTSERKGAA